MMEQLLEAARIHLVSSLRGKTSSVESRHPWRRGWQFAALHSMRVENYAVRILNLDCHDLDERGSALVRLAAILHDLERMGPRESHAARGAEAARDWLLMQGGRGLAPAEIEQVTRMIAAHSNKKDRETDYPLAVLKDADTLDEIGLMSIFMAGNWLDPNSPFFFSNLLERLESHEIPFCDEKMNVLNTAAAKDILREKMAFISQTMDQIADETGGQEMIAAWLLESPPG